VGAGTAAGLCAPGADRAEDQETAMGASVLIAVALIVAITLGILVLAGRRDQHESRSWPHDGNEDAHQEWIDFIAENEHEPS
jgi:hypothetical protein